MASKKALGKGLKALLPDAPEEEVKQNSGSIIDVEVARVSPNPFQPRESFDPVNFEELKKSISENGLVQPISVRVFENGYQLIAGERRLRAVRDLGFETIPAYVLDVRSNEEMLELAIIENVHREDLNPLDIAGGYQRLIDECRLTQEQVALKVGKDRTTVTNFLRLLRLPRRIQDSLRLNELSMGHARALIALERAEDQIEIWQKAVKAGLSVRKVEEMVRALAPNAKAKPVKAEINLPYYLREIEDRFRRGLATQVHIKPGKKGGKIEIEYYNDDDLMRLVAIVEHQD